jgi:hypothetical protein
VCVGLHSNIRALYNGVMIIGFLKLVFSLNLVYMICSNNSKKSSQRTFLAVGLFDI